MAFGNFSGLAPLYGAGAMGQGYMQGLSAYANLLRSMAMYNMYGAHANYFNGANPTRMAIADENNGTRLTTTGMNDDTRLTTAGIPTNGAAPVTINSLMQVPQGQPMPGALGVPQGPQGTPGAPAIAMPPQDNSAPPMPPPGPGMPAIAAAMQAGQQPQQGAAPMQPPQMQPGMDTGQAQAMSNMMSMVPGMGSMMVPGAKGMVGMNPAAIQARGPQVPMPQPSGPQPGAAMAQPGPPPMAPVPWFTGQSQSPYGALPAMGNVGIANNLMQQAAQASQSGNVLQGAAANQPIGSKEYEQVANQGDQQARIATTNVGAVGQINKDNQALADKITAQQNDVAAGKADSGSLTPMIAEWQRETGTPWPGLTNQWNNFGLKPADEATMQAALVRGDTSYQVNVDGQKVPVLQFLQQNGATPIKMPNGDVGFVGQDGTLLEKPYIPISPAAQADIAAKQATAGVAQERTQALILANQLSQATQANKIQMSAADLARVRAATSDLQANTNVATAKALIENVNAKYQSQMDESKIKYQTAEAQKVQQGMNGGSTVSPQYLNLQRQRDEMTQRVNATLAPFYKDRTTPYGSLPSYLIADKNGTPIINPALTDPGDINAAQGKLNEALTAATPFMRREQNYNDQLYKMGQQPTPTGGDPYGARYAPIIQSTAIKYGVDPAAVQAIIKRESGGNPGTINKNKNGTTDYGIMQVNSATKDPSSYNWRDPAANIDAGVAEFAQKLKQAGGDYHQAFHLYNGMGAPSSAYADPVFSDYSKLKGNSVQTTTSNAGVIQFRGKPLRYTINP